MSSHATEALVLTDKDSVMPYVNEVVTASDRESNALGFYARNMFNEFAKKEKLYIAVVNGDYAGHILFDCRPPRAKVLQVYVLDVFRGKGIGNKLVDKVKSELTENGVLSIYARVAEDLVDSNRFWESQGFYVQNLTPGGKSKNRVIVNRVCELEAPQLFEASGISSKNPLGYRSSNEERPIYLLDMNILFDVGARRPKHDRLFDVFRSERMGFCSLAISTEIEAELERNSYERKTDPMLAYSKIFPVFSYREDENTDFLLSEILSIVFGSEHKSDKTSENSVSDVKHLVTVIQHQLSGLITNDAKILNAGVILREEYGIEVLSSDAFKEVRFEFREFYDVGDNDFQVSTVSRNEQGVVYDFLTKLGLSVEDVQRDWYPEAGGKASTCMVIKDGDDICGYLVVAKKAGESRLYCRCAVDEEHHASSAISHLLISKLVNSFSLDGYVYALNLRILERQYSLRESASEFGFVFLNEYELEKTTVNAVVSQDSWDFFKNKLSSNFGLELIGGCPSYKGTDQLMEIKTPGDISVKISLDKIESLFSPGLFCLPGRNCLMVPVQNKYSDLLLGTSPQPQLLASPEVGTLAEKHYVCSPKAFKLFSPGSIILFYESLHHGGRGGIVAIAKTKYAYLKPEEAFNDADLNPSILSASQLELIGSSPIKTVVVFSNVVKLEKVVDLSFLKRIGYYNPAFFITTRRVDSDKVSMILAEGLKYE